MGAAHFCVMAMQTGSPADYISLIKLAAKSHSIEDRLTFFSLVYTDIYMTLSLMDHNSKSTRSMHQIQIGRGPVSVRTICHLRS
jgi:hypothetical protein